MSALKKEAAMEMMPTPTEVALARDSSRSLAQALPLKKSSAKISVQGEEGRPTDIVVPASALRLFINLLSEMAQGNAVTLMPLHAELTTQQAADLLNVSRPFLIKLLDERKIPFRKVGRHRRVFARDLISFRESQENVSESAIDTLVSEAQRLKLGYE